MKETDEISAFPQPIAIEFDYTKGLTLRDYFAGQVIQGLSSMEDKGSYSTIEDAYKAQAAYAYSLADAMLNERNK